MMTEQGDKSVSIGRVLGRAFGVIGDNPGAVVGIAFLLSGLPGALFNAAIRYRTTEVQQAGISPGIIFQGLLAFVVTMVLQAFVSGCITRATVAYSHGKRASIADCFSVTLPRMIPVIAVSILSSIGIGIGTILLVIPGLILACMWAVILPVTVAENVTVSEAFSRASALSRGAKWKIFGLLLLTGVIIGALGLVMALISGLALGMSYQNPVIALHPLAIVVGMIATTINTCIISSVTSALFVELREWKDGPMDTKLSDIFA